MAGGPCAGNLIHAATAASDEGMDHMRTYTTDLLVRSHIESLQREAAEEALARVHRAGRGASAGLFTRMITRLRSDRRTGRATAATTAPVGTRAMS